jgi:hypothetical protein
MNTISAESRYLQGMFQLEQDDDQETRYGRMKINKEVKTLRKYLPPGTKKWWFKAVDLCELWDRRT